MHRLLECADFEPYLQAKEKLRLQGRTPTTPETDNPMDIVFVSGTVSRIVQA
jgi:hypothetical protein